MSNYGRSSSAIRIISKAYIKNKDFESLTKHLTGLLPDQDSPKIYKMKPQWTFSNRKGNSRPATSMAVPRHQKSSHSQKRSSQGRLGATFYDQYETQRSWVRTANKSTKGLLDGLRTELQSRQQEYYPSRYRRLILVRSASRLASGKSSNNIKKGLTSAAKATLILNKYARNNPFYIPSSLDSYKLSKHGLYSMVNAGHVPKFMDTKALLNKKEKVKKKPSIEPQPAYLPPQIQSNVEFFVTGAYTRIYSLYSHPATRNDSQRRSKIKLKKQSVHEAAPTVAIMPPPKGPITFLNYSPQEDENYQQFKEYCLLTDNWSLWQHHLHKIQSLLKKYKIRKAYLIPKLTHGYLFRLTESQIISMFTDGLIIGNLIRYLVRKSYAFRKERIYKVKCVLLMLVEKFRYRKKLNQVSYINTIKNLYRLTRESEEVRNRLTKTLNFKYYLFADQQRVFQEGWPERNNSKKRVYIHLNSVSLPAATLKSYYKYSERINIQLTRIFKITQDYNLEIVYVSPYPEVAKIFEDYYRRLLALKDRPEYESMMADRVHFLYITSLGSLYGRRHSVDYLLFYSLKPKDIQFLKDVIKNKYCWIVPGDCTQTTIKLSYLLDVPCYGGTFDKVSIKNLYDRAYEEQNCDSLINTVWEFRRFAPLLKLNYSNSFNQALRKRFEEKKETYFLQKKIKVMHFANSLFSRSVIRSRYLFKRVNLCVPLAMEVTPGTYQYAFYMNFAHCILDHKDKNGWLLKLEGREMGRGIAYFYLDTIKIINYHRKKSMITIEVLKELSSVLKIVLRYKLKLSHPGLQNQYAFLYTLCRDGGVIEAVSQGATSPCIYGSIYPDGKWVFHGTCRKIPTSNFVNNLILYPAAYITEKYLDYAYLIAKYLYAEGVFGYIIIQMLIYVDGGPYRRHRHCYYLSVGCRLTNEISMHFLLDWLELTDNKCALYCPFIDNNGYKCTDIRYLFEKCQAAGCVYDPTKKYGTLLLPLGHNTTQVLSLLCIGYHKRLYRVMADCMNLLNSLGAKCMEYDRDDPLSKRYNIFYRSSDGYYMLDTVWRLREINRSLN